MSWIPSLFRKKKNSIPDIWHNHLGADARPSPTYSDLFVKGLEKSPKGANLVPSPVTKESQEKEKSN